MKDWLIEKWLKFKTWFVGLLVAVGVASVPIMATAAVSFSWSLPTSNTDGTLLPVDQIVETRIYCDVDPAAFVPQVLSTAASHVADGVFAGPLESGDLELHFGRNDCFATVLAQYTDGDGNTALMESDPSGVVTKIVTPPKPNAPGLDP